MFAYLFSQFAILELVQMSFHFSQGLRELPVTKVNKLE